MDYTALQNKISRTGGNTSRIPEGTVYTEFDGHKGNHIIPPINDPRYIYKQPKPIIITTSVKPLLLFIFVVSIVLLHYVMKPDGNILEFVWETILYAKELLVINFKFSVNLLVSLFNFTVSDILEVARCALYDTFEVCSDYISWVAVYFAG